MDFFLNEILIGYIVIPLIIIFGIFKMKKKDNKTPVKSVISFLIIYLILRTVYLILFL